MFHNEQRVWVTNMVLLNETGKLYHSGVVGSGPHGEGVKSYTVKFSNGHSRIFNENHIYHTEEVAITAGCVAAVMLLDEERKAYNEACENINRIVKEGLEGFNESKV